MNGQENRVTPADKTPLRSRTIQSDEQGEDNHQLIQQLPSIKSPPGARNMVTHKRYMGKVKELNVVLKENDVIRMEMDQLQRQLVREKEDGAEREKKLGLIIDQLTNSAKRKKMMCVGRNKLRTSEDESRRMYWDQRLVAVVSRCYSNWKSNINIGVKKQVYGKYR